MDIDLHDYIATTPDFPKKGIMFRDINPLIGNGPAYKQAIDQLINFASPLKPDIISGPEARGFVIGSPMAYEMGIGFVPARKYGKLPRKAVSSSYGLEYGHSELQMHVDAIKPGQRVFVVDDLLATGGTITATIDLIRQLGGIVVGCGFFIELEDLHGREKIMETENIPFIALLEY
ncbi:adenine phosphoribosyltransferase [Oenococcus kitaharae]|uniref:Adenine phosphoribosyltransferase n=1 Tax=Oenococcus kitaharae DSM 17330 TaxID=1045004 RepID=G9WFU8_9LACO|nr:adenine phosphoribosyltransferase [Oenococcus kitaharae]EHN59471.1 Adenine phosphoribosyltransferase [Oenococcus kitaharae DSM 17330]MCV3295861.1 adenine phosphoribosyltransferase [Oenococcus kitaharae]OEY83334.1 adenine phosphoribosyltransferase [Oenococcus kitaharae]OEY85132.1 adenine phosphoribosyltransferase [Oenococcus kitaharae]OEY85987.1 adenine phosphoribosyltransferase [Oenococcus kitaharae]